MKSNKMVELKVAFLGSYLPKTAGTEIYLSKIAQGMTERGIHVQIVTYSYGRPVDNELVKALPTVNMKYLRGLSYVILSSLYTKLKDGEFDVYNAHYALTSGLAATVSNLRPRVITCHGTDVFNGFRNLLYRGVLKYVIENSNHVVFVSNYLREKVRELGIKVRYSSVIPGGVNEPTPSVRGKAELKKLLLNLNKDYHVVSFLGGLYIHKGAHLTVDIAQMAQKMLKKDVCLLIIGDGPLRSWIQKRAEKAGQKVIITGYVMHEKVRMYLQASDILIVPSIEEGLGLSCLEGLAAGVPVVAFKTGGIPEIIRDMNNGVLVEVNSIRGMAEKITLLIESSELRSKIVSQGYETAKQYSWRNCIEKYIKLFYELAR